VPALLNEEPNAKAGGVEAKLNEPFPPMVVDRGNVTGWPLFSDPNVPFTAEDRKENPVEPIDPFCEAGLELSSFEPLVSAMTVPKPAEAKLNEPFSPKVVDRGNATGWALFSDPNFPVTAEDGKENPVEPIDALCEAGLELSSFEPLVSAMTAPKPAEVGKENPEELIDPLVAAEPKLAFTHVGWFSTGLGVQFSV